MLVPNVVLSQHTMGNRHELSDTEDEAESPERQAVLQVLRDFLLAKALVRRTKQMRYFAYQVKSNLHAIPSIL